jgi:hypothetical protein
MSLTRRIATQTLFGQDLPDGGDRIGRTLQVMIKFARHANRPPAPIPFREPAARP